jgi:hypothetical protein
MYNYIQLKSIDHNNTQKLAVVLALSMVGSRACGENHKGAADRLMKYTIN